MSDYILNINDFPNEILFKILDCNEDVNNCMLVCKRWKILLEEWKVFGCNTHFRERYPIKKDLMMARDSVRKFRNIRMKTPFDLNSFNIQCVLAVLNRNQSTLEAATLITEEINARKFCCVLNKFRNVKDLILEVNADYFIEDDLPSDKHPIKFMQLKRYECRYSITGRFHEMVLAPNLEEMLFTRAVFIDELGSILDYLTDLDQLKFVQIGNHLMFGSFFEWNLENFSIMFSDLNRHNEEMKRFLITRCGQLKSLKIRYSTLCFPMINFILEHARNLEFFELELSDRNRNYFEVHVRRPSVKKLIFHNMDPTIEIIMKIHSLFPNIKSLELRYPEMEPTQEVLDCIKALFPHVEDMTLHLYHY